MAAEWPGVVHTPTLKEKVDCFLVLELVQTIYPYLSETSIELREAYNVVLSPLCNSLARV